jgi:DNA polymerase V
MDFIVSDITQRIAKFKAVLGIKKQNAFAEKLDISRTTLIGYEDGSSPPSAAFLIKLCEIFNVNINWLLTGTGEMFLSEIGKESANPPQLPELRAKINKKLDKIEAQIAEIRNCFKEIGIDTQDFGIYTGDPEPGYGTEETIRILFAENIAAGPPIPQSENLSDYVEVPRRFIKTRPEDYYAARIKGESMSAAGIPDGSMVLIRKSDVPRNGAIQVVRHEGSSTLKRMREHEDHHWTLQFEDNTGRYIELGDEEYQVQGDFVAVLPEEGK